MSTESEISTVLKVLRDDAKVRQSRLDQLNSVIRMYESELERPDSSANGVDKVNPDGSPPTPIPPSPFEPPKGTTDEKYPQFPKDEHLIHQIPYVLKQRGMGTKFPVLQDEINAALRGDVKITEHQLRGNMYKLLEKGDIVRVKFNKSNLLMYYVFPEWIETNEVGDKKLMEQFMPSKKDMPAGIHTIEFISQKGHPVG